MSLDQVDVVRGRTIARISAGQLRERAVVSSRVLVDVGAGDGRLTYALARAHPDWLCVAIDACVADMRRLSLTAGRKPARGGAPNALFLRYAAEALPGAAEGLAHEVTVHYPWGSLLRAVVDPNPEVLGRIARLGRPGARLQVLVNATALPLNGGEAARIQSRLQSGYAESGIRLASCRPRIAPPQTSWSARLHGGQPAVVLAIDGIVVDGGSSPPLW